MHMVKLRDDFYWTGVTDENLRVFDIIMYTEFGTTYNSYVLKAGDKTILFETAKAKFFEGNRGRSQHQLSGSQPYGAGSCGKR